MFNLRIHLHFYTLLRWVEIEFRESKAREKICMVHGAWSRSKGAPGKFATSNQSSLQDVHACTNHHPPCGTRHICLLIICGRLLSCRIILYQQNTCDERIRRARELSDRHQRTERLYHNMRYLPIDVAQVPGTMAHFQTLVIRSPYCREYLSMYP